MYKITLKKYHYIFFVLFFALSVFLLHNKSYKTYPSKIHAWAQSDHYVLSLGFLDNGFDFFHPQTYSLTHQFPPKEKTDDNSTITAVDFPLLQYSAAILMNFFDTKSPWIYRLLNLIVSFLALFVLFKTFLELKGFWQALFVCGFILFIPVYSYYQNGFIPSMTAFNSLIIGVSLIVKHHYLQKPQYWYFGILFLTLAALMRFTQVTFLIALAGVLFLEMIRQKKISTKFLSVLLGLMLVAGYFLYNSHLSKLYGSVFLNKPLVYTNLSDLFDFLFNQVKTYLREVFTLLHIVVLVLFSILLIKQNVFKKIKSSFFVMWFFISLLGVLIFNILMMWSMSAHDYYALDTWIPIMSLGLIILLMNLDIKPHQKYVPIFSIVILMGMLNYAVEKQYWKYKFLETPAETLINDFSKSSDFLNHHLGSSSKVLVISGNGWNTPMVKWNRKVYRLAWNFEEELPFIFDKNYDFIVTQNESFESIITKYYSNFQNKVDLVADNSRVSIWKIKK